MLELAATCNMNDKFKVKKINKIIKKHTPIIPALCSKLSWYNVPKPRGLLIIISLRPVSPWAMSQ